MKLFHIPYFSHGQHESAEQSFIFNFLFHDLRILIHNPRKSPLVQRFHIRIRIELLDVEYACALLGSVDYHHGTDHSRYACRVGDGLGANLFVALLVVAYVINIDRLLFSVLHTGKDTADVCLSDGSRT